MPAAEPASFRVAAPHLDGSAGKSAAGNLSLVEVVHGRSRLALSNATGNSETCRADNNPRAVRVLECEVAPLVIEAAFRVHLPLHF
jgi:hypothetical protein